MKSRIIMKNAKIKLTSQKMEIEKLKVDNRELAKKQSAGSHLVFAPVECHNNDITIIVTVAVFISDPFLFKLPS